MWELKQLALILNESYVFENASVRPKKSLWNTMGKP